MTRHCVTISNIDGLLNNMKRLGQNITEIVDNSLKESTEKIAGDAKAQITAKGAVDMGLLRNDINVRKEGECVWVVNSPTEYAIFVEFGTGSAGDPAVPHTTRPKWVYFSERAGDFRTAYPQAPRPFMRPAFAQNQKYVSVKLKQDIINAWKEGLK